MTPWLPAGGPMLRASWLRPPGSDPGLHGWAGGRAQAGALADFDSEPARWELGLDLSVGVSLQERGWRLDAGWSAGGRLIPATPEVRSPEDLANAGWLFLVTGPHLGLRLGAPTHPGLLIQLELAGTWLDLDADPATGPRVHPRFGLWAGLELPFRTGRR